MAREHLLNFCQEEPVQCEITELAVSPKLFHKAEKGLFTFTTFHLKIPSPVFLKNTFKISIDSLTCHRKY